MNTDACYANGWVSGIPEDLPPGFYRADFDDSDWQVARWDGYVWSWCGGESQRIPSRIHPDPIPFDGTSKRPEFPCPWCSSGGTGRAGEYEETLVGWHRDATGHNHNPNYRVGGWQCYDCGARWTGCSKEVCPVAGCDHGGPDRCCGADGRGVLGAVTASNGIVLAFDDADGTEPQR